MALGPAVEDQVFFHYDSCVIGVSELAAPQVVKRTPKPDLETHPNSWSHAFLSRRQGAVNLRRCRDCKETFRVMDSCFIFPGVLRLLAENVELNDLQGALL